MFAPIVGLGWSIFVESSYGFVGAQRAAPVLKYVTMYICVCVFNREGAESQHGRSALRPYNFLDKHRNKTQQSICLNQYDLLFLPLIN